MALRLFFRKESQYLLTFLFFIMGIAFFQAALNAIAPSIAFFVLNPILFIDGQIAVGIWYGAFALIALYFS